MVRCTRHISDPISGTPAFHKAASDLVRNDRQAGMPATARNKRGSAHSVPGFAGETTRVHLRKKGRCEERKARHDAGMDDVEAPHKGPASKQIGARRCGQDAEMSATQPEREGRAARRCGSAVRTAWLAGVLDIAGALRARLAEPGGAVGTEVAKRSP